MLRHCANFWDFFFFPNAFLKSLFTEEARLDAQEKLIINVVKSTMHNRLIPLLSSLHNYKRLIKLYKIVVLKHFDAFKVLTMEFKALTLKKVA